MKYYIGIDLGGTNVRTLLVDENGQSYSEVKDATEREKVQMLLLQKSVVRLKQSIIQYVVVLKM